MTVRVFAPAKINLTLHVTGQRADGFHLLDSLVVFADVGDVLTLNSARSEKLSLSGPQAKGIPVDGRNLVLQVVSRLWKGDPLQIHLEKHLPAAAGIGGGSADAAACFRGISFLMDKGDPAFDINLFTDMALRELTKIGADIPMCVLSKPARIRGIGERIKLLAGLPQLGIVMVNPRCAVSTPTVFKALENRNNPPMTQMPPVMSDAVIFTDWLSQQRNDLEVAAISQAPEIGTVLGRIRQTSGCLLARMSGSGATCFGLYKTPSEAARAAQEIRGSGTDWWVKSATMIGDELVKPQLIRATT